jgi:(p)ppGpp synthase/HD superfamily hydrolase
MGIDKPVSKKSRVKPLLEANSRRRAEGLAARLLSANEENPSLRTLGELAGQAADFAASLSLSLPLTAATYLHNFVYNNLISLAEVESVCGERVAWLCGEATRILTERGEGGSRGKSRARQRVRYYVAAYRDPELGLLAVATLWARWQVAKAGSLAQRHTFAEEARHAFGPLLEMMGMRAILEELEDWLWRLHEPDAGRVDALCRHLSGHVAAQLGDVLGSATVVYRTCSPTAAGPLSVEHAP